MLNRPTKYEKPGKEPREGERKPKGVSPIDKHVGARVRMRRLMLDMSQEKLAHGLGLTFQQVQKYEKGTNRIGSSRLAQIAYILKVPVPFFFEGEHVLSTDDFTATKEFLQVARAFQRIESHEVRRSIVTLVESLANGEPDA